MNLSRRLFAFVISAFISAHALAADVDGVWNAAFRYRFESVDDTAFVRDANAHTARLRLGWRQPFDAGFSALIEGEGVVELNDQFNSTANRQTTYPVVPDARALELNQALVSWQKGNHRATLGRQRLVLDNHRFIGNVGWRQNEQTFDALSADTRLGEVLTLRYSFLDRVHRINGDEAINPLVRERDLATHLVNASYTHAGGTLTSYGYFMKDQDVAAASSRTLGLRWTQSRPVNAWTWGWSLEVAHQSDYANNPNSFNHTYVLVEPNLSYAGLTWRLGYERLGGNGVHAFQTPLATLHAFNGWADKFLITPNAGLEDFYLSAGAKLGKGGWKERLNWVIAYHDFSADQTSAQYGREWDASLGLALPHGWSSLLKLADYRSDGFGSSTRKVWLQFEWAH